MTNWPAVGGRLRWRSLSSLLASLLLTLATPAAAWACAAAPPAGEEVRIAEEEAIILYDAARQRQTFIRRADFRSSSAKFGFLVPTPTKPVLGEVPERVFADLGFAIAPEVRFVKEGYELDLTSLFMLGRSASPAGAQGDGVRVLGRAKVAGFDATILTATDARELGAWLGKNGFENSPEIVEWLGPYVRKEWIITAFAVAAAEVEQGAIAQVTSKAVAMSFDTPAPLYPYREPLSQRLPPAGRLKDLGQPPSSRMLRVFFVGEAKMEASLEGQPWSARVLHAGPLDRLSDELAPYAGKSRYLTVFVDESFPRTGKDEVFFAPAAEQRPVRQPPKIIAEKRRVPIFLEVVLLPLAAAGIWLWRRRR